MHTSLRLARTGEAIATGKARSRRQAMLLGGYALDSASHPKQKGVTIERALRAYEAQLAPRGKGGVLDAMRAAEEKIVEALNDPKIDIRDRLNIAKWVAEFGHKRTMEQGEQNTASSLSDLLRFRLAILRAVQKGILLGLRAGVTEGRRATEIAERLADKIDQLAVVALKERLNE